MLEEAVGADGFSDLQGFKIPSTLEETACHDMEYVLKVSRLRAYSKAAVKRSLLAICQA